MEIKKFNEIFAYGGVPIEPIIIEISGGEVSDDMKHILDASIRYVSDLVKNGVSEYTGSVIIKYNGSDGLKEIKIPAK